MIRKRARQTRSRVCDSRKTHGLTGTAGVCVSSYWWRGTPSSDMRRTLSSVRRRTPSSTRRRTPSSTRRRTPASTRRRTPASTRGRLVYEAITPQLLRLYNKHLMFIIFDYHLQRLYLCRSSGYGVWPLMTGQSVHLAGRCGWLSALPSVSTRARVRDTDDEIHTRENTSMLRGAHLKQCTVQCRSMYG